MAKSRPKRVLMRIDFMSKKILVPIFADQLSAAAPALQSVDPEESIILMMEVSHEAEHVPHHSQKLVFLFSAMRHFAAQLEAGGYTVDYVRLTDPDNTGSFERELSRAAGRHRPAAVRITEPSVYRVLKAVSRWGAAQDIEVSLMPDSRFLCSKAQFSDWAADRKSLRMEYFYRDMRRRTGLLMNGEDPEGGQWNYDKENRKSAAPDLFMPAPYSVAPDAITQGVIDMVTSKYPDRFGKIEGFDYAVTRREALKALKTFIAESLPRLGDFQDAMLTGEPYLYHSRLSPYLNAGLLGPMEICQAAETAYKAGKAPLNAAEGFIRQVIGWREYVRGIYWLNMPGYVTRNALSADRSLPGFYWSGETNMYCLSEAIGQTIDHAYAHHIQRLMITGNFALLAGIDPHALHEWYLSVYVDAFEWVEMPNTIGMSQFADNGLLASKPYISSGAYIDRMSNYCGSCSYVVKQKSGPQACPFNYLYWDFLARHKARLSGNPRMAMMYRNMDRMDADALEARRADAARFLSALES